MSQFHSRRRRYERVTRLAELSGREEEETQRERQRNCRNIRKNERERGRLAAGCRMQRCPEYDGKQRLSNFTKPDAQSTGGERRARARQSLGRVPSGPAAGGEDATRRRRLSREGRTEKHREQSRRLRGKKKVPLHLVKSMIRTFRDQIFQDENLLYSQGLPPKTPSIFTPPHHRFVSLLQPRDEQRMSPPPSPIHIREEKVCGGNPRCTTAVPVHSKW